MKKMIRFHGFAGYRYLYLMSIPVIAYYVLFCYVPMYGIQIAFKDYNVIKGFADSPWVGLQYFKQAFSDAYFWNVTRNTLIISFLKLAFGLPAPIVIALLLNEINKAFFKRTIQTIIYLPRFISWVIIAGILYGFLSINDGVINRVIELLGGKPIMFLMRQSLFRPLLVITDIWKNAGWGTIIYLAALSSINPELYDAAVVDGAGRFRQMWHISLPGMIPVIITIAILSLSNIMNAGFDQVFVLYNPLTMPVGDIIDTYIFRSGLESGQFSFASAVGLFKSTIGLVLIFLSDRAFKAMGSPGLI